MITKSKTSTPKIMLFVIISLLPAIIYKVYVFSLLAILSLLSLLVSCIVTEIVFSKVLKQKPNLKNYTTIITALLLFLAFNPNMPYFVYIIAGFVAIFLGKLVYGGLGKNIFNPAMVGWCFVMLSYPQFMTKHIHSTHDISISEQLEIFTNQKNTIDSYSQATPLGEYKSYVKYDSFSEASAPNIKQIANDLISYNQQTLILNILILIGGLSLLALKVINYIIPSFFIIGTFISCLILGYEVIPAFKLFITTGPFILAAFYIITDPVSSPNLRLSQILYSFIIAFISILIAKYGAYPIGVAFATIFTNAWVFILDKLALRIQHD